jgi:hypothetical protein
LEGIGEIRGRGIPLRTFLPFQLRDVGITIRVLSFGYDSDTAFSKAVTDIDDVAAMLLDRLVGERQTPEEKSRAIIFIAHSLGGIVVKKVRRAFTYDKDWRLIGLRP